MVSPAFEEVEVPQKGPSPPLDLHGARQALLDQVGVPFLVVYIEALDQCEANHSSLREALLPRDVRVTLEPFPEMAMQWPVDLAQRLPVRGVDSDVQLRDVVQHGKL